MKKLFSLILYISISLVSLEAQKHDYNWMVGDFSYYENHPLGFTFLSGGNIINFEENEPNLTNTQYDYACRSNCHSASDSLGNLLFFFNGKSIYNANDELIENGENINRWHTGSFGSVPGDKNSTIIPLTNSEYIIFHLSFRADVPLQVYLGDTLFYTKVDMKLNNGAGKVIEKNKVLMTGQFIPIINPIKHANGRDWYLLIGNRLANKMHRIYLNNGLIEGPFEQNNVGYLGNGSYRGGVEVSVTPNGEHLIMFNQHFGFSIFDIDRCSGLLGAERQIPNSDYLNSNGLFGSNNMYYFGTQRRSQFPSLHRVLMQMDISVPNPTLEVIAELDELQSTPTNTYSYYGSFVLNPGGKIFQYGAVVNGFDSISGYYQYHVIDFPDRKGTACHYRHFQEGFRMKKSVGFGVPYYPNYRLGPIDGSPCDTLGLDNNPLAHFRWDIEDSLAALQLTFTDLSAYEPATWSWDFGDPASGAANMSSDTSPVHVFSGPGIYQVCQTVCNVNSCDTVCKEVVLGMTNASNDELRIQDGSFVVYPNPVEDVLYVRPNHGVTLSHPVAMMQLYDIAGRLVFEGKMSKNASEWRFLVGNVGKGLYFYEIKNDAGAVVQVGKVVRQ